MSVLHRFTNDDIERLQELWSVQSIGLKEIARLLAKHPKTVDLAARELGLESKLDDYMDEEADVVSSVRVLGENKIKMLQKMLDDGVSPFNIEMRTEIPQKTIKTLIAKGKLQPSITTGGVIADGWFTFGTLQGARRVKSTATNGKDFLSKVNLRNQDSYEAYFLPSYHNEEEIERFLREVRVNRGKQVAIRLIQNNRAYKKRVVDISTDPDILATAQPYVPEDSMEEIALKRIERIKERHLGGSKVYKLPSLAAGGPVPPRRNVYKWTTLNNWQLKGDPDVGLSVTDVANGAKFFLPATLKENDEDRYSTLCVELDLYEGDDIYLCFDKNNIIIGTHPVDLGAGELFTQTETRLQSLKELREEFTTQQKADEELRAGLRLDAERNQKAHEGRRAEIEKTYLLDIKEADDAFKLRATEIQSTMVEAEANSRELHKTFVKALDKAQKSVDRSQAMSAALTEYLSLDRGGDLAKAQEWLKDANTTPADIAELHQKLGSELKKRETAAKEKDDLAKLAKDNPELYKELMEARKTKQQEPTQIDADVIKSVMQEYLGPMAASMQENNRIMLAVTTASAINAADAERYASMLAYDEAEGEEEAAKSKKATDAIAEQAQELMAKGPFEIKVAQGHPRNTLALRANVDMNKNPNPHYLRIALTKHLKDHRFMVHLVDYEVDGMVTLVKNKDGDVALKNYSHKNFYWKETEDSITGLGGKRIVGIPMPKLLDWYQQTLAKLPASKKKGQRN